MKKTKLTIIIFLTLFIGVILVAGYSVLIKDLIISKNGNSIFHLILWTVLSAAYIFLLKIEFKLYKALNYKRHLGEKIVIGGNVEPDLREVIGVIGYGSRKRVWAENLSSEWRKTEKMKKTKTHWQTLNKR